jgi:mycoredoxin-dependent peroxiredoxin
MAVQVGDLAPDFALKNQHGETVQLSQFRGDRAVVVVFYPWAFSGVCGGELNELQKHLDEFQTEDVALLTISTDAMYALRAYADREGFTFPMLQDFWPHGEVASSYGVFEPNVGVALRGTFIIDKAGVVRWTVTNPIGDARDLDDYRAALAAL